MYGLRGGLEPISGMPPASLAAAAPPMLGESGQRLLACESAGEPMAAAARPEDCPAATEVNGIDHRRDERKKRGLERKRGNREGTRRRRRKGKGYRE